MGTTCPSCESAIDHCHGTLIVHLRRVDECTDANCIDIEHARHTFVVDCTDVAGGCACTVVDAAGIARRA
jgi:hypothetical protein